MAHSTNEDILTLPNILTLIRMGSIPILVGILHLPGPFWSRLAAMIFVVASITDLLDGFLARRMHSESRLGQFMDPVADKLLIASVLIMLVSLDRAPAWMAVLIICRELAVTGLRAVAAKSGLMVPSDRWGKWKTTIQMTACTGLLAHFPWLGIDMQEWGLRLLWAAIFLTTWSGISILLRFQNTMIKS